MSLVVVKCPQCGAELNTVDDRDFMFCSYCGSKVAFEKQLVEISGTITVDGIASSDAVIDRAEFFMSSKDFDRAISYFDKALDLNPRCSRAHWNLLLCKNQCSSNEELLATAKPIDNYPEYKNAVKFAEASERTIYESICQTITDKISSSNAKRIEIENAIQELQKKDKPLSIGLFVSLFFATITLPLIFMKNFLVFFIAIIPTVVFIVLLTKVLKKGKKIKELNNQLQQLK